MDKLSKHAFMMLEIIDNEHGFYKNVDGEVADIARAVYDIILRLQVNEAKARKTDTPQTECRTCKWAEVSWTSHYCDDCKAHNKYEPNDTPQADEDHINNLPWTEVGNGEQTDCNADQRIQDVEHVEPTQTDCEITKCDYHKYCKERGQTDCPWK